MLFSFIDIGLGEQQYCWHFLKTSNSDFETNIVYGRPLTLVITLDFQVAHNSTNFHAIVLMKNLRIVGLKLPSKVVFADTMDIMSQVKVS